MRSYTSLTWPDDPYRTGQQLYARPAPRLAAFTVIRAGNGSSPACRAAAIVYLPLHRTQTLAVTQQTVAYGFRAASAEDAQDAPALLRVADLDLMQARRHAAVLAGHMMADDLAALRALPCDIASRGVHAVERQWARRSTPGKGMAAMIDCGLDLPGAPALPEACQRAGVITGAHERDAGTGEQAAALAVQRALTIGLVCARHLGRWTWEGSLDASEIMAASTWDCFPNSRSGPAGTPGSRACQPAPRRPRLGSGE